MPVPTENMCDLLSSLHRWWRSQKNRDVQRAKWQIKESGIQWLHDPWFGHGGVAVGAARAVDGSPVTVDFI